jgi:hypothetical protein
VENKGPNGGTLFSTVCSCFPELQGEFTWSALRVNFSKSSPGDRGIPMVTERMLEDDLASLNALFPS